MWIHLDTISECDGQTDRQTDGQIRHNNIALCVHNMLTRDNEVTGPRTWYFNIYPRTSLTRLALGRTHSSHNSRASPTGRSHQSPLDAACQ